MRGIGCDMAMSDVEERRGLKITPGSVEVRELENWWQLDTVLMSYFVVQVLGQFSTIESAAGDKS